MSFSFFDTGGTRSVARRARTSLRRSRLTTEARPEARFQGSGFVSGDRQRRNHRQRNGHIDQRRRNRKHREPNIPVTLKSAASGPDHRRIGPKRRRGPASRPQNIPSIRRLRRGRRHADHRAEHGCAGTRGNIGAGSCSGANSCGPRPTFRRAPGKQERWEIPK